VPRVGSTGEREGRKEGGREEGKAYLGSVLVKVEHEALSVVPVGRTHSLPPALVALDAVPGVAHVLLHPPRALVAPVSAALAPPGGGERSREGERNERERHVCM